VLISKIYEKFEIKGLKEDEQVEDMEKRQSWSIENLPKAHLSGFTLVKLDFFLV